MADGCKNRSERDPEEEMKMVVQAAPPLPAYAGLKSEDADRTANIPCGTNKPQDSERPVGYGVKPPH